VSAEVIKDFLVGLGFKVDDQGLAKFSSGISKATVTVGAIGAAVAAAAGYVTHFVNGVANAFDDIQDVAERTNTAADAVARLGYVAELTDSTMQAASASLEGVGQAAGLAMLGVGRAKVIFEKIGVSVADQNGKLKDTSVLMADIGQAIKGMEKGQQLAILGKLGIDPTMIKALTTDISGLQAEFDSLYKNAGINVNDAAAKSSDFVDTMKRMKMTLDTVRKAVGIKFMDRVGKGLESFRKFIVENMPRIIQTITPVVDVVLRLADVFLKVASRIGQALGRAFDLLGKLSDATGGWSTKIIAAAAAWKFLNLSFLATPLGQILALVAAVALLIDDFIVWKNGGESLIDWGTTSGKVILGIVAAATALTAAIIINKAAIAAWTATTTIAAGVMKAVRTAVLLFNMALMANPLGFILAGIVAAGALLGYVIYGIIQKWDVLKAYFLSLFQWLEKKFNAATEWMADLVPDFVSDLFGGDAGKPAARLTPSPQAAAAIGGNTSSINQKTEIIVQGSTNPETTARAVAGQQNRVTADMARNMKGAAR
jgi:hypothetical protein